MKSPMDANDLSVLMGAGMGDSDRDEQLDEALYGVDEDNDDDDDDDDVGGGGGGHFTAVAQDASAVSNARLATASADVKTAVKGGQKNVAANAMLLGSELNWWRGQVAQVADAGMADSLPSPQKSPAPPPPRSVPDPPPKKDANKRKPKPPLPNEMPVQQRNLHPESAL
eukprot:GHVN01046121.1.p1 GENE.GHVN01046121.1~~GHVN01046121.1.p1  ORF type:complete len:169 (-),score=31.59 GHVN01046121.1:109-615(-)